MKEYYSLNKNDNHKYVALKWNKQDNDKRCNIFHRLFPALQEQKSPQNKLKDEVIAMNKHEVRQYIKQIKEHEKALYHKMYKNLPTLLKKYKDHQKMSKTERHFLNKYFDNAWKSKIAKMNKEVTEEDNRDYLKAKKIAYKKLNNHQKLTDKEYRIIKDDKSTKAFNKAIDAKCNKLQHQAEINSHNFYMRKLKSKHANSTTKYTEVHGCLFLISDEGTQVVRPNDYIIYDEKFLKNLMNLTRKSRLYYPVLYVCNNQNISKYFKEIKNPKLPTKVWLVKEHKYHGVDYKNVAVTNSKLNAQYLAYKLGQKSFENDYIYQEHKLDWNKMMNISK